MPAVKCRESPRPRVHCLANFCADGNMIVGQIYIAASFGHSAVNEEDDHPKV